MVDAAGRLGGESGARMSKLFSSITTARGPGGETILCVSRRDTPLLETRLFFPGGDRLDPDETPGLAALTADLLNEGPEGLPSLEWHRLLDRRALSVGFSAHEDVWTAGFNCLAEDTEEAARLLKEAATRPALPRGEWRRFVKQRRAAAKEEWAQPAAVIGRLARAQFLGRLHPNAHPSFEKSFARARYAEAAALGKDACRRGGEVYGLLGGDMDAEAGARLLSDLFAALPDGVKELTPEPEPKPSRSRVWLMDEPKIDQAFFVLSRPGVRAGDPDRVALRTANYALGGGGFSSRLMARVRAEMGHTYGISSSCPEKRTAAPFSIRSFTRVENLAAMLDLIDRVAAETVADGFTQEEYDDAREHLYGALPLQLASPPALLSHARKGLEAGLTLDDLETDHRLQREISLEKVNAAARRLLGDGAFHLALIGPAKKLRPAVEKRGEVVVIPFRSSPDNWPDG